MCVKVGDKIDPGKVIAGHWQDPAVQGRIGAWARAAAGAHEARTLKVCRFGDNMRDVAVTEGDKAALDEAREYLAHPILGPRLREAAAAVLAVEDRTAELILGPVDGQRVQQHIGG